MSTSFARPSWRDEDVRRLDVAVHDLALPGMRERAGDLQRVVERVAERQRTVRVHQVADVRAVDVLEHDVADAAVFADVVHAGDVRMIEPRGRAGLRLKPPLRLRVAGLPERQHLHRHGAVQVGVPRAKHGPHPAAADKLLQQHVIELLAFERLAQLARVAALAGRLRRPSAARWRRPS